MPTERDVGYPSERFNKGCQQSVTLGILVSDSTMDANGALALCEGCGNTMGSTPVVDCTSLPPQVIGQWADARVMKIGERARAQSHSSGKPTNKNVDAHQSERILGGKTSTVGSGRQHRSARVARGHVLREDTASPLPMPLKPAPPARHAKI